MKTLKIKNKTLKSIGGGLFFLLWIVIADWTYLNWLPDLLILKPIWTKLHIGFLSKLTTLQLVIICILALGKLAFLRGIRVISGRLFRLLANCSLFVISILLALVLFPSAVVYGICKPIYLFITGKLSFTDSLELLSDYFLEMAHSLDQTGNTIGMFLLNDLFLASAKGEQYGNPDQTISYITGIGDKEKRLTNWLGIFLSDLLGLFEKDHVQKAASTDQFNDNILGK